MTQYITRRRARFNSLCGDVNIPYGTILPAYEGFLFYNEEPLCVVTSENCHTYFCGDEDSRGAERGKLIDMITKTLQLRDERYQARWNKIWADKVSKKYKKKDFDDYWLWGHDFYEASVEDLQHIAELVKE